MRSLSAITGFMLLSQVLFAQEKGKMNIAGDCSSLRYCNDCGETKASFKGKLTRFFEREINFRDLDVVTGVIVLHLVVDSSGNACTKGIYNRTMNTDEEVMRLKLNDIVSHMPLWNTAVFNGSAVNSSVLLAVYSHVYKHGTFEVNYLRADKDKKWMITDSNGARILLYFDETSKNNLMQYE